MFFAGLFGAYFTLRSVDNPWPPPGVELAVGRTAVATLFLIASSGTVHLAHRAALSGDRARAVRWLGATVALGLVFLANQALEYAQAPFSISSHAYGSIFYLLTGFHGLHVIGGLVAMVYVGAVIGGRSRAPAGTPVTVLAYYWHFVDVVWIALYATVYLLK
ncbi:MAG: heme-copper oxidase subunit III [Actinobacteria bacterium]|nr:heme-copper oxidase subunit III [Actinomycetota bacterium]